jgi:hypothetical protein
MKFRNISVWIGISLLFTCSGIYHTVEFESLKPATLNLPDNVSQLLTKREVIDLCYEHYSDAILSLESFHLSIENKHMERVDTFVFTVVSQLISKATWFIYLPQSPKPFSEIVVTDTLAYLTSRDIRKPLLPDLKKVRAISYESGLSYGQFVSPVWSKTERSIYSGRALELKEGSELTEKGEWDKAYTLWNDLSHNGRRKNRASAFYNMAVFYELKINWIRHLT